MSAPLGDDRAPGAKKVVEGEVGSARLKDPTESEEQGQRAEQATLPEAALDVDPSDAPAGGQEREPRRNP